LTQYESDAEDGPAADNNNLNWSISGVDPALFSPAAIGADDVLTLVPVTDAVGSDVVTLTLTDSDGLTAAQNVTITVVTSVSDVVTFIESTKEDADVSSVGADKNAVRQALVDILDNYFISNLFDIFYPAARGIMITQVIVEYSHKNAYFNYKVTIRPARNNAPLPETTVFVGISDNLLVAAAGRRAYEEFITAIELPNDVPGSLPSDILLFPRLIGPITDAGRDFVAEEYSDPMCSYHISAIPSIDTRYPYVIEAEAYAFADFAARTKEFAKAKAGNDNACYVLRDVSNMLLIENTIKDRFFIKPLDISNSLLLADEGEVLRYYYDNAPEFKTHTNKLIGAFHEALGEEFLRRACAPLEGLSPELALKVNLYLANTPVEGTIEEALNVLGYPRTLGGFKSFTREKLTLLLNRAFTINGISCALPEEITSGSGLLDMFNIFDALLGAGEMSYAYLDIDIASALKASPAPTNTDSELLKLIGVNSQEKLKAYLDGFAYNADGFAVSKVNTPNGKYAFIPRDLFTYLSFNYKEKGSLSANAFANLYRWKKAPITGFLLSDDDVSAVNALGLLKNSACGYNYRVNGIYLTPGADVFKRLTSYLHGTAHNSEYGFVSSLVSDFTSVIPVKSIAEADAAFRTREKLKLLDELFLQDPQYPRLYKGRGYFYVLSLAVEMDKQYLRAKDYLALSTGKENFFEEYTSHVYAHGKYVSPIDFLTLNAIPVSVKTPYRLDIMPDRSAVVTTTGGEKRSISVTGFRAIYLDPYLPAAPAICGYLDFTDDNRLFYALGNNSDLLLNLFIARRPFSVFLEDIKVYPFFWLYYPEDKIVSAPGRVEMHYMESNNVEKILAAAGFTLMDKDVLFNAIACNSSYFPLEITVSSAVKKLILRTIKLNADTIQEGISRLVFTLKMTENADIMAAIESLGPSGDNIIGALIDDAIGGQICKTAVINDVTAVTSAPAALSAASIPTITDKVTITPLTNTAATGVVILPLTDAGGLTHTEEAAMNATTATVWEPYEISLATQHIYTNSYTDVSLSAVFTGPAETIMIDGFWDGGQKWKIRMAPTETGRWSYVTSSNDPQLNGKTGTFDVMESGKKGFVVRDPDYAFAFKRSNGARILLMGDTNWNGMSDRDGMFSLSTYNAYIDNRSNQKFNFIRSYIVSIYPASTDSSHYNEGGRAFEPWNPDSLNPWYFKEVDRRIEYANSKGITMHLLLGSGGTNMTDFFGWDNGKMQRYIRYIAARYSAYDISWEGRAEFEEQASAAPGAENLANQIGNWLEQYDPYGHLQSICTIDSNSELGDEIWLDWIMHRLRGWYLIIFDRWHNKPVVNEEFYLENSGAGAVYSHHVDADAVRKGAWDIMTHGASGFAYGNTGTYNSRLQPFAGIGYSISSGADYMTYLYDFWITTDYWKLSPNNGVIQLGTASATIDIGNEYVIYIPSGGFVTVDLSAAGGTLSVEWYNPRAGTYQDQAAVEGGASRTFIAPDTNDWALHIKRNTIDSKYEFFPGARTTETVKYAGNKPSNNEVETISTTRTSGFGLMKVTTNMIMQVFRIIKNDCPLMIKKTN
jgi:hypothetical protein